MVCVQPKEKSVKGWYWNYFYDGQKKYKTNGTHNKVWCKGCVKNRKHVLEANQKDKLNWHILTHVEAMSNADLKKQGV